MNRRRLFTFSIGCLLTVAAAGAQASNDRFADVERLYASAAFEEALAALGRVSGDVDANEVDEYRALCLLGLNRTWDAEQAVERLVLRRPSSALDVTSRPPKFASLYRSVRKRTLPTAAMALYTSAKASFEDGQLETASSRFRELLAMLADPDVAFTMGDVRALSDGFLMLIDQRLVDVRRRADAEPRPSGDIAAALSTTTIAAAWDGSEDGDMVAPVIIEQPAPAPSPVLVSSIADQVSSVAEQLSPAPDARVDSLVAQKEVYESQDNDVVPPVVVDQRMPAWVPPNPFLAIQVFRGTIEIVIGEDGSVESSVMSKPAFEFYDWELLGAAQRWKYRPATKDGRPVKYRKSIAVMLGGSVKSE